MSEERKKEGEAAWKAEEDEKLSKSRAFLELTEYIAKHRECFATDFPCYVGRYPGQTKFHTGGEYTETALYVC